MMQSPGTERGTVPVSFVAGATGLWRIERITAVRGQSLPEAVRLDRIENEHPPTGTSRWTLRGVTSNARYTNRSEKSRLESVQEGLNRPSAKRAALIPILKTPEWWDLLQDERRAIFEARSHHISLGWHYLPAVARRLYHWHRLSASRPLRERGAEETPPSAHPVRRDSLRFRAHRGPLGLGCARGPRYRSLESGPSRLRARRTKASSDECRHRRAVHRSRARRLRAAHGVRGRAGPSRGEAGPGGREDGDEGLVDARSLPPRGGGPG